MIDIYITHKAFNDCIVNGSNSFLDNIIKRKEGGYTIYAADEQLWESGFQDNSAEFNAIQMRAMEFKRGVEMAEMVKSNCNGKREIKGGLSTAIFILGEITQENASIISYNLGVMCFPDSQIPSASQFKSASKTLEIGEPYEWSSLLTNYSKIPVSSIIINDKYLFRDLKKTTKNLNDIMTCLFTEETRKLHILLLCGSVNFKEESEVFKQRVLLGENMVSIIKSIKTIKNVTIELLFCKGDSDLNKVLHNRFIITNYGIISAEETLSAFTRNNLSEVLQTVSTFLIFSDNMPEGFEKWRKYLNSISKLINEAIRNNKDSYPFYTISNGVLEHKELYNMKNKLIELREGDKCYYLSVPNQNNWAEIYVKKGTYHQGPYANCIYSKTKAGLEIKAERIQTLFKHMDTNKYLQCFEISNSDEYYRISISDSPNFGKLEIIRDGKDTVKNQIQYLNNHFLMLEHAVHFAEQIKSILGGGIPIIQPE